MAKKGKVKLKRSRTAIKRPIRYRKYQQFFLIVCEDEKTEPAYFEQFIDLFPEYTMFLKTVGTGNDPLGVVKASIEERERFKEESKKDIDFVWAVFDKDDADENKTKIKKFERAFETAKKQNINIAYSNEAFELWLLLHFSNIDATTPLPRKELYRNLEVAINKMEGAYQNFAYKHGNIQIIDIVKSLGNEKNAIKRAIELLTYHKDKKPIKSNPSTKMHLLVKELRAWIQYYNWEPEK